MSNADFDRITHEPLYVRAIWRGANKAGVANAGAVPVLVIAWSLGATRAYCLLHIDRLDAGNYSACWLPSNQLDIQA
jgi:hypothetical protein